MKISKSLRENACFEYIKTLPDQLKRTAVYYEYWRESPEHIKLIAAFRTFEGKSIPPELTRQFVSKPKIFLMNVADIISSCEEFPEKPFRKALKNPAVQKFSSLFSGMDTPCNLQWPIMMLLRDNFVNLGGRELDFYENFTHQRTFHAVSIPWTMTNDEIVNYLAHMIPRMRPAKYPEPAKAGRRGRSPGSGISDMLNQLAAFRLDRAGVDFHSGQFPAYTTEVGWKKAVQTAKIRIQNILVSPIFLPAVSKESETK